MESQFLSNAEFYFVNVVAIAASLKQTKGIFVCLKLLVCPELVYSPLVFVDCRLLP